ncbi:hypothetical protein LTR53_018463, partial [Teratosphaeriaceae sp. CCFEE 6253]
MPASRNPSGVVGGGGVGAGAGEGRMTAAAQPNASQPNLSLRTRRQSTMPLSGASPTKQQAAAESGSRGPRKSVAPGMLATMLEGGRKGGNGSGALLPAPAGGPVEKAGPSRTSSLTGTKARRTTLGPAAAALAGADVQKTGSGGGGGG